eukprot:CAMPEP_0113947856 /NCGR_PEP_ID=MMETSP1339-20121228/67068_1 /TAXON_ID=94617 /ORGANISM="Fibrocapsa japonica" /LENGTH=304 /DNA_ID=CAMNT_0000954633 /DNA_START=109 /DNA_END=1023 /DNA_ORIENTATION=+ /assembly_acc=CAM_ASM_000762
MEYQDWWTSPIKRPFHPEDIFFEWGNLNRELACKQSVFCIEAGGDIEPDREEIGYFICELGGCEVTFTSISQYEAHYRLSHVHVCAACHHVLPSARLLDLHLSERHSPFLLAQAQKGIPVYECLVDGCPRKFKHQRARHLHLVDFHKYPRSYDPLGEKKGQKPGRSKHTKRAHKHGPPQISSNSAASEGENRTVVNVTRHKNRGAQKGTRKKIQRYDKAPCWYFLSPKGCKRGDSCQFSHTNSVVAHSVDAQMEDSSNAQIEDSLKGKQCSSAYVGGVEQNKNMDVELEDLSKKLDLMSQSMMV